MGPAFSEKSVWVQFVAMAVVLTGYFVAALVMRQNGVDVLVPYVPLFAAAVVLMIVVLVVGHVIAASTRKVEGADERDRLIEWRAEAQSGWILGAGVLSGITAMILNVDSVLVAHILLGSLFLSEMLKYGLQIVAYRRGF